MMGGAQLTTLRRASSAVLAPEPLLPRRLRLLAAVLLAACVAMLVVLVVHFAGHQRLGTLDAAIDPSIMDHWDSARLPFPLAELGTLGPVALMTLALVVACVATRRWSGAILAAVAAPTASGLAEYVLKPCLRQSLDAGFPSGHATSMFALAAVCAVLLADPPHRRVPGAVRLLLVLMALAVATAVALTMIASGAHTFTDSVAGAAVGTGVALVCALTLDLVTSHARRALVAQSAPGG
jgi:membrane-associated phospholipid phosphatase